MNIGIMLYVVTAILWGIYAVRRQTALYGQLENWRVPLVFCLNAILCPLCIVMAIFKNH